MAAAVERPGVTREALFDAAKKLFQELGYARTSHADIAYEVGIGRTTFYEHFASKEDLLVQLVKQELPVLIDAIIADVDPGLDPRRQMFELTSRMVEFLGTDNLGLILHTEVPKLSLEAQAAIASAHSGMSRVFMTVYHNGVAVAAFREMPLQLAGRLIEQTIMTGGRVLMDSDDPKQHVHQMAEMTADFLVHALSTS
jgi:AcrR family transcriptional regulator